MTAGIFRTAARGAILAVCVATLSTTASPLRAADRAADLQFATAAGLHNRQAFDLAADEWTKFLADFPNDKRTSEARHYLGICLLEKPDYAAAAATFEKLIQADPKFEQIASSQLYLGLAQFNLARGGKAEQFAAAEKTFAELLKKTPEGKHVAQAVFYRGEALYELGKKPEAIDAYRLFIRDHADDALLPNAMYALGVALDDAKQRPEAAKAYDAFREKFPEHELTTDVGVRRADLYVADGKFSEAEKLFAAAVADKNYDNADYALLRQAGCLSERKKFAEATKLYDELPQRFAKSQYKEAAALASGRSAYFGGDYAGTTSRLVKLVKQSGEVGAEAAHWSARASLKLGKPEAAVAVIDAILKSAAKSKFAAQLELDRGDALYEIDGRRDDALAAYRNLAKNHADDPLAPQAQYLAAFTALDLGRNDEARTLADGFLKSYDDAKLRPAVEYVAAEAALRDGKYDAAVKQYDGLLKAVADHDDRDLWTVRRALALSLAGRHDDVIKSLGKTALKLNDKKLQAEARHLLGLSRQATRDYKGAAADLEAALSLAPDRPQADETMLALAETQRLMGNAPEAQATLAKFAKTFPKSRLRDTADYRSAELAFAAGDWKSAETAYRRVLEDSKSRLLPHAEYGLAWTLLNRGDASAAATAIDGLLERSDAPADLAAQARYVRALAKQRLKQYQPAVDDLETYLKTKPKGGDRDDALYVLGLCQEGLNRNEDAAKTFTSLLDSSPKYTGAAKVLYELGWVYNSLGKKDDSTAAFARLAKEHAADPLAAEAYFHVGEAAYAKKDFKAATEAYFEAEERADTPDLAEKASHKLGWSYFQRDNFAKAEEWFAFQQGKHRDGPLAADAAFMQAEAQFKQGKYKEALASYARVKNPQGADFPLLALLHAGQAAVQLEDWKQARSLLDDAAKQFPESPYLPEVIYERAWVLQNLGEEDEALKLYEQVTTQTDREIAARSRFMIGEVYFNRKNHAEAVRHFFKAAFGYGYPEWQARSQFEAGRCFEMLGKLEQAKQSYKEVVEKYPQFEEAGLAKKRLAELGS